MYKHNYSMRVLVYSSFCLYTCKIPVRGLTYIM